MRVVNANGAAIPSIGLGTWQLRDKTCAEMVAHGLSVGYRHLDTAAMYENEAAVGEGLRASGINRDDVFVTTKVWFTECREGALSRSAEASLQRLGLDQIDLLLIHWPNPDESLQDQIRALNKAKADGLARHIGVSNFPAEMMRDAAAISDAPLVTNQVEYHPYLSQTAVLAACREAASSLTSYCPIARAAIFDEPVLKTAAEAHGRTVAQVVLRWHVQQGDVIAIPRSSKPERIEENIGVYDFELSDAEMTAIHGLARPGGRTVDPSWAPAWDT